MKYFLILLKNKMKKRYPEIRFEFYLSKGKKNVHIGLGISLTKCTNCLKIVLDIKDIWMSKKTDDTYTFVNPKLAPLNGNLII